MQSESCPLAKGHLKEQFEVIRITEDQRLAIEVIASHNISVLVGEIQPFQLGD